MGILLDSKAVEVVMAEVRRGGGRVQINGPTIKICCPFHNERTPSCFVNIGNPKYPIGSWNCFGAGTLVQTWNGVKRIEKLVGKTTKVIDGNGDWVETVFREYGKDTLYRIDLSRNMIKKTIYATGNHRWFAKKTWGGDEFETTTAQLKSNHTLVSRLFKSAKHKIDPEGVRHGFIYGDGCIERKDSANPFTRAYFCSPEKEALLPYFDGYKQYRYDDRVIADGGKASWKELPDSNSKTSYLLGFLAGYFAADGCVATGSGYCNISSSDKRALQKIKTLFAKVGITTMPINPMKHEGEASGRYKDTPLWQMNFVKSTMWSEFFLNSKHKANFDNSKPSIYDRMNWRVVGVKETKRVESVYCCEVETTHSFLLADNLLTGNCFGCPESGGWNKLAEKAGWQKISNGMQKEIGQLAPNLAYRMYNIKTNLLGDDTNNTDWTNLDAELKGVMLLDIISDFRGINKDLLIKQFKAKRYISPQGETFYVLPVTVNRTTVGLIKARMTKKEGKSSYYNSKGDAFWVKQFGLFGFDQARRLKRYKKHKMLLLVEGPRDALNCIQHGVPAVCYMGGKNWTDEKRAVLEAAGVVAIGSVCDNDKAGRTSARKIAESFQHSRIKHKRFRLPREEDVGYKIDPAMLKKKVLRKIYSTLVDSFTT